ncbi:MAG: M28 family metallopeptidase [Pseudomonadales bacterium]|nr:M28 family metallopeptidase [Pseudomonadales bacterium]MBO6594950.1 M28 family metallopeptidase [Pseudomonadales bacterium]MBO6821491.1 M28 family metallopeptidase [Pseudomonadales bacterium]
MKKLIALLCSTFIVAAQATPERLFDIASSPSPERIEKDIQTLVEFGTRHTLSDVESDIRGIGAARRWIKTEFEAISASCGGCLEVEFQRHMIGGGENRIPDPVEIVNVIAILRGTDEPNRYVVMSGDIDSRVTDVMDAESESPGANDNASGMAGTIEAARVLSKYRFPASIVFAGLSGEEQGLFGGRVMASQARTDSWQIQAVLNNDMIGNTRGINGVVDNTTARIFSEGTRRDETMLEALDRRFRGGEVDSPSRNLARYIDRIADDYLTHLDTMMIYRLDRFRRGGHHSPFNEARFPAVRIMETNEHYDRQHQDLRTEEGVYYGDTIEFVDFDYAAKLTALNAVSLAAMAWAPAPPRKVSIEGAVMPDTTLQWQKVPGAVSYRVYWRLTTDAQWRWHRDAGDVAEYTLKNVVIDNYFFGVASVNKDGIESPVVFPGVIGAF